MLHFLSQRLANTSTVYMKNWVQTFKRQKSIFQLLLYYYYIYINASIPHYLFIVQ
jgi:hypothetical protein